MTDTQPETTDTRLADAEELIAQLRAEVERLTPPCDGGCNPGTGPQEDCSQHGRPVREVWNIAAADQRDAIEQRARAEKAEQECRDLCQSDGDVRARLADAENALARVRGLERKMWAETEEIEDPGNTVRLVYRHILAQFRAALDGTS